MTTLRKKFSESFNFVYNKRVILRIDLNLPKFNNEYTDLTRLEKVLPTIEELLKHKAKIIIVSHFGRPEGKKLSELSLKPLLSILEKYIQKDIFFFDDDIKKIKSEKILRKFKSFDVILLENIRFYEEEHNNENSFSKHLSSLGEIFINDCFSGSHREHSSIIGLPKFLPSFPGKLLEDEVKNLKKIISSSASSNSVAVLGGSKVSTKLHIIEFVLRRFSKVLIGGAMANTFLSAKGIKTGNSVIEKTMIKKAKEILENSDDKLILPDDVVVDIDNKNTVKDVDKVLSKEQIFDLGPKSRMKYHDIILKSDSILWNGPLGKFEVEPFDAGTKYILGAIKTKKSKNFFSVSGGGDTISMLKKLKYFDDFSYVSTGGGAFLEFIQGTELPGLIYLNK